MEVDKKKELMKRSFTKDKDTTAYITNHGVYAEVVFPISYFENSVAEIIADKVETLGFFKIRITTEENSPKYKDTIDESKVTTVNMNLPMILTLHPSEIVEDNKQGIVILRFYEGDELFYRTRIAQNSKTVYRYYLLLKSGKIPPYIPYNMITQYFIECAAVNGSKLPSNVLFLDLQAMVICRDKNNTSRQFRSVLQEDPKHSLYDYHPVNLEIIPKITSPWAAFTSSNPKLGMTTVLGAMKNGDLEITSASAVEKSVE